MMTLKSIVRTLEINISPEETCIVPLTGPITGGHTGDNLGVSRNPIKVMEEIRGMTKVLRRFIFRFICTS